MNDKKRQEKEVQLKLAVKENAVKAIKPYFAPQNMFN